MGESGDAEMKLNIRCSNGNKFSVRATLRLTIAEFKELVAQNGDVPANQQRLIYKGRILKDDQTLQSYGLQADHTIHMVRGSAPASTAGPTGGVGLGGVGLEQVQQQLAQNPNMPSVQNMLNNPEIMRSMMMNNPQMREIIDRNPELGHILNDPAILRQTLEAARNPELMREMMRNTDRAMSNIESSPEGFNMLRRMYENVQEPFLNATTPAGNDPGSNPFAALLGNQAAVNNPAVTGSETTPGSAVPNSNPLPNPWGGNTTGGARTNAGTRPPTVSGLGGAGLLGSDRPGGMPDMSQLMQNPAISQMMRSMLSNPQYMQQIVNQNPQLHSLFDSNPQLREMLQNPEVLRQLTSPQMIQQMMSLQQLLPQLNQQQSTFGPGQTGDATGAQNNVGLDFWMNMFGGHGADGLVAPNILDVPPEQLYATQLSQLQEMGFFDTQENIRALRATAGNVHAAVERLLGNFGP